MKKKQMAFIIALLCVICLIVGACSSAEDTVSENISQELSDHIDSDISFELSGNGMAGESTDESSDELSDELSDLSDASIHIGAGEGAGDFKTVSYRFHDGLTSEGLTPAEALQAFLDEYENYTGTEYAKIGCIVKITVSPHMTTEEKKDFFDTLQMIRQEYGYACLKELYYVPSADGLAAEYYADMTAKAIRAVQACNDVTIVAWSFDEISENAVPYEVSAD